MNLIGDTQTDKTNKSVQKKKCMMDQNVFVLCHEFDWGKIDRQTRKDETNKSVQEKKA